MGLLEILRNEGAEILSDPVEIQKAFAYVRVSHEDSAERGTSIETQRRDIERYAAGEGIEIVEWFEDAGKSAFKDDGKRIQFNRMIARASECRDISLILVWKSDRFSRDRYQAAAVKGQLAKVGIRMLSVLEPYDARTTSGIVLESVTDAMNQIRSMEIGKVTHRNLLTNCTLRDPETGWTYKNGGWAQFGYKNHRVYADSYRKYQRESHCIWILDEENAAGKPVHEWARTMLLEWRLRDHMGADAIAMELTRAGVPTPSGRNAWSDSTVNNLLMPERLIQYAGFGTWNKIGYPKHGGKLQKDRSEWKIIEKAHAPIITLEEADAIQALRQQRVATPGRKDRRHSPYVLTGGLLTCGICGANYAGKTTHGDYYVCGSHIYRHGAGCGPSWPIPRELLEKAVWECITRGFLSDAEIGGMVEDYNSWAASQHQVHAASVESLQQRIAELNEEISNLSRSLASGVDPAVVRDEINERAAKLRALAGRSDIALPKQISAKKLRAQMEEIGKMAQSGDPVKMRAAMRLCVASLEADAERRKVRVLLQPLSSVFQHSLVAPGGVEPPPRP